VDAPPQPIAARSSTGRGITLAVICLLAIGLGLIARYRGGEDGQTAAERAGEAVWVRAECGSCHSFARYTDDTGPHLRGVMERLGTNVVRRQIRAGKGDMPASEMSEQDLDHLMAYIAYLERTGEHPPDFER